MNIEKLLEQLFLYDEGDLEKEKQKIEDVRQNAAKSVARLSEISGLAPDTLLRIIGRMSSMTGYKWYEIVSMLTMFYNIKRNLEKGN